MTQSLFALLADGNVHSGASLGDALGLSRAAVWKQIQKLEEMGASLRAVKGVGYQLASPIEMLQESLVLQNMSESATQHLGKLDIQWSIPSTNEHCLKHMQIGEQSGFVCFAEHQHAGRGRRGRQWVSPVAANLYLSIGWRFSGGIEVLEGLSLAIGVAVAETLSEEFGIADTKLKWPNDILCHQRKLGGVLIEMNGDASGPCNVVIGLGLNVCMTQNIDTEIDQPWTDLYSQTNLPLSRNYLAARLLNRLLVLLATYESHGFSHYCDRWQTYDAFADQQIILSMGDGHIVAGSSAGITDNGGLVMNVDGVRRVFKAGEVSLRRA